MDAVEILDVLERSGVVRESGEGYQLSTEYLTTVGNFENELRRAEGPLGDRIEQFVSVSERDVILDMTSNETTVARYLALDEHVTDLDPAVVFSIIGTLDRFHRDAPPQEGAPDSSMPVHGDQIEYLSKVYSPSVVYIWKDDCPPCDVLEADLDSLSDSTWDDVTLFSVYGPEWSELLYDEYDVVGGPTILFMVNGFVDSRLTGKVAPELLPREIEKIQETDRRVRHEGANRDG